MKLDSFNPSFDEVVSCSPRVLFGGGDVWKTDNNGVLHEHISREGNLLTVRIPENIPMKYKGRKLIRVNVYCNACDLVTGIEAFYSLPALGGYALAFRDPDSPTFTDVSEHFK